MTDFVKLWLSEGQSEMAKRAARIEGFFSNLANPDSNYGRAHRLTAEAYRKAEKVFADSLRDADNGSAE